jgi:hypothetical protein
VSRVASRIGEFRSLSSGIELQCRTARRDAPAFNCIAKRSSKLWLVASADLLSDISQEVRADQSDTLHDTLRRPAKLPELCRNGLTHAAGTSPI